MTPQELQAAKIPTIDDFYGPFFKRTFFGGDYTRHVAQFRRLHSGTPLTTTDKDHPEDDGWYYPVIETQMVSGSKKAFQNQISQQEYQGHVNAKKRLRDT